MINKLIILMLVTLAVAACSDDSKDRYEQGQEADKAMSNGGLSVIPTSEPDPVYTNIDNHPLRAYFNPYGSKVLDYFGKFWRICNPKEGPVIKDQCDAAVNRAISLGKKRGIQLTRNDLVNEAYWKKHLEVYEMKKKASRDWKDTFPRSMPGMLEFNKYNKAFREKEYQILQSVGGE